MQDLTSEFSKIFRGWYPWTLTAGGGDPLPHPTPSPAFGPGRGAQAPRCWDSNPGPINFSAAVAPLTWFTRNWWPRWQVTYWPTNPLLSSLLYTSRHIHIGLFCWHREKTQLRRRGCKRCQQKVTWAYLLVSSSKWPYSLLSGTLNPLLTCLLTHCLVFVTSCQSLKPTRYYLGLVTLWLLYSHQTNKIHLALEFVW